MSEQDHEHWKDEAAAYVLGALEPGEAADFERHAAGCADCRAELRWLRPAVNLLPASVEQVDPPAELRARILDQARSEPARPAPSKARRRFLRRAGGRWRASRPWPWRLPPSPATRSEAAAPEETRRPPSPPATLPARSPRSSGSATRGPCAWPNMPQLPKNRVLQAWVQRGKRVKAAGGLFVADREGRAATTIPDMKGVDAVMVTAEPRGGSEFPTTEPMVTVSMPQ